MFAAPKRRTIVIFACACALLILAGPLLHAQSPPATVEGTITATDGTPIAQATITLHGPGWSYAVRTDAHGGFVALVEPGRYEIQVVAADTSGTAWSNVLLPPGRRVRLSASLTRAGGAAGETPALPPRPRLVDSTSGFTLSDPLLTHLPLARRDAIVTTAEVFPGISRGSALGAGAETSTGRRVDGIDLSDPLDGRAWTSHIATTADQFSVRLAGANAAEGGITGAAVDVVTRAGGNQLSGFFDARVTAEGFGGKNLTDDLTASNPFLSDADRLLGSTDVSGWLGGPLRRDSAFFSVAMGYGRDRDDPTGPRTIRQTTTPRVQGRVALIRQPSDVVTATAFFEEGSAKGLAPDEVARVVSDPVADHLDRRTTAARVAWQRPLSQRIQLQASYSFIDGSRDQEPASLVPGHLDGITGAYTGSQGQTRRSERQRHLASGSLAAPIQGAGRHIIEAGAAIESSRVDETTRFVDDTFFVDFAGRPNLEMDWAGSRQQGRNRQLSAYVQDGWAIGSRLTVNGGVRVDQLRGASPGVGTVYDATTVQPRVGATIDLAGNGTTIARAHYGQYAEPLSFSLYDRATPGVAPIVSYEILASGARREVERVVTPVYHVDGALRQPRVDESSFAIEHRLGGRVTLGVTGVLRDFRNVVDAVLPDARWIPVARPGLANRSLTLYRWANRASSETNAVIRNVDGVEYLGTTGALLGTAAATRQYRGVIVDAHYDDDKGRWTVWGAWTAGRAEGTVDNAFASSISRSGRFESPSAALVNVDGQATRTPAQKVTLLGTARVPWIGARISAVYIGRSGLRYAAVRQFGNETLDFPLSEDGRQVLLEARGTRELSFDHAFDLRGEYTLRFGRHAVTLYADVVNLPNRATVLDVETFYPLASAGGSGVVRFEAPTEIRAPRQLYLGGRWAF